MHTKETLLNYKRPFYLTNSFITIMACLWPLLGVPLVISIVLSKKQKSFDKQYITGLYDLIEKEVLLSCEKLVEDAHEAAKKLRYDTEDEMIHLTEVNLELIRKRNANKLLNEALEEKINKLLMEQETLII